MMNPKQNLSPDTTPEEAALLEADRLTDQAAGLVDGNRHDAAAPLLERATELDPEHPRALGLLADLARARGDPAAARAACRRLLEVRPFDQRARFLDQVLGGEVPSVLPVAGLEWPAPFVRLEDVLPADARDALFAALTGAGGFDAAEVVQTDGMLVDRRVRSAEVMTEPGALARPVTERLAAVLPDLWDRLAMAPFVPGWVEAQATVHRDGDFYDVHRDWDPQGPTATRRLSFVYYLHRTPRPYTGGDLLLYDTACSLGLYRPGAFTRLTPLDNSLVLFPSQVMHEVTPVRLPGADPADGRFTVNGWLHV
jgi:predicted 2-oxoglutarate/Fe(II)-dependent dioxygenase YbiX